jgi:TetR/AcrR family transcriptional regulator
VKKSTTKDKYHKETFDKIPDEKRQKILKIATKEFAKKGFTASNINVIARNAGISIGSMYNYFNTKEDLFLTVIDDGYSQLERILMETDLGTGDIFDKLEKILGIAQQFSRDNPDIIQVYLNLTSEGLSYLSQKLSRKIENIGAWFYRQQLEKAKAEGVVDPDLDVFVTSLCIDNIILLLQFSYTSEYYKERLKTFIGEDALDDDKRIIRGIMRFFKGALSR